MPPSMALRVNHALPQAHRERLLHFGREVHLPPDTRLLEEGGHAGRFWIIQYGTVALDIQVPDRRPPVVETLGAGDLVGWSWLYEPYAWQLGAATVTQVQAYEFDAVGVRLLCLDDAEFGQAVEHWVGRVLAHRLAAARALLAGLCTTHEGEERDA